MQSKNPWKIHILVSKPRWTSLWAWVCVECHASEGHAHTSPGDAADAGREHYNFKHVNTKTRREHLYGRKV